MTHEQKLESAEFRTREDQIETMTVHYMEAGFPINAARSLARDGVAEAEARGAANALAEQRRKDAEGAEAWLGVDHSGNGLFTEDRHLAGIWEDDGFNVLPLYTRPANVAALEARVRELEAQLVQSEKRSFDRGYLIACCNISHLHDEPSIARDVLAECGLSAADIRSIELSDYDAKALAEIRASRGDQDSIREGGEHG